MRFPCGERGEKGSFVGSHKASGKILFSSCASRLCAAAAETTGS